MFRYCLLLVSALTLFLSGFFPISNSIGKFDNDPPIRIGNTSINIDKVYKPHFTKTVIFVIDALRWDFITADFMPQTTSLMKAKGCLSKVFVESPTVTLPRIKALTTGSIPQYIDIVRNLASSEILSDSWLHSAKKKGLKTVFYGDNTWEKLFPDFFTRSEGTTSFFVWDFTEVDNNVTRNVHEELQKLDWDVMILHYLGLDHIGHVLGPFSSKVPPKLKEMDEIIYEIYEKTQGSNTLILVTGDHGMKDSGGHGGTTQSEVTVPLVAIGLECENSSFLQTDIPANLAVLLGLHIPSTSIGKIQKEFLKILSLEEYLFALRYNTELLLKKNDLCGENFRKASLLHEIFLIDNNVSSAKLAAEIYQDCSERIMLNLYKASSKQDMSCLFVSIFVILNALMMLLVILLTEKIATENFQIITFMSMILMMFFANSVSISVLFLLILSGSMILKCRKMLDHLNKSFSFGSMNTFLLLTCTVHPLTFISTSFIEEEHYYWFHSTITLILLFILHLSSQKSDGLGICDVIKPSLVLIFIRFSMDLNSTLENSVQNIDNWANILLLEDNFWYHQFFFIFGLISVYSTLHIDGCTKVPFPLKASFFITLILILLLKSTPYHNSFLGKSIWALIIIQKICFKEYSWNHLWIHASTLLINPHNIILISFAVYSSHIICHKTNFKHTSSLTAASYLLSNCFYFLQGHRNSLASVDISIGYTGLNDYYPLLVISQVLIHTYSFQVLFHIKVLSRLPDIKEQHMFWATLLSLRASVVLSITIMMIVFKHHLFIWSVFAPKLFIESVHTMFLFIELSLWYIYNYLIIIYRRVGKRKL